MKLDFTQLRKTISPAFYPLLTDQSRYLVLWGGAGSGKSVFVSQKIILRILKAIESGYKEKFLILRKTQPAAKRSVAAELKARLDEWKLGSLFKFNQTELVFTFAGGSQILCGGLDDPEKIKSIQGITGVWIEEATEISFDDFTQVNLRLRGITPRYKQIIVSFNPIDFQHWLKKRFFDENPTPDQTSTHHSTYLDNPFDKTYNETLDSLTDANHITVYKDGLWGQLKGLIYPDYALIKDWPDRLQFHGRGLDFGYSNDETGLIEVGVAGDSVFARELIYKTRLTNQDICEEMIGLGISPEDVISADCAEPKSIEEIYRQGFNIHPCTKGKDSVNFGIQRVKQYRLHVTEGSINLIKELNAYKWGEDKNGNQTKKPVDAYNHLLDPLRYILTHLVGMPTATVDISGRDEKEERKEILNAEDYDMMNDEVVWDTNEDEGFGI